MIKLILTVVAAASMALFLQAAPAMALNAKSFVSGHGSDSNACTFAAPCRTLNFAIKQTSSGGEVDVLDPADYSPVNITQAITIVNDGAGTASILAAPGLNAIGINAGANDVVNLRGLTIDGGGVGANGIRFNSGQSVNIEKCAVRHFSANGFLFAPSAQARNHFTITNTTLSNNANDGILVAPNGQTWVFGVISHVTTSNNVTGIEVLGTNATGYFLDVTVTDSIATSNTSGLTAHSAPSHASAKVLARNTVFSGNSYGIYAEANAFVRLDRSATTGNDYGISTTSGGVIQSYGNNSIDGDNQENATLTSIPLR